MPVAIPSTNYTLPDIFKSPKSPKRFLTAFHTNPANSTSSTPPPVPPLPPTPDAYAGERKPTRSPNWSNSSTTLSNYRHPFAYPTPGAAATDGPQPQPSTQREYGGATVVRTPQDALADMRSLPSASAPLSTSTMSINDSPPRSSKLDIRRSTSVKGKLANTLIPSHGKKKSTSHDEFRLEDVLGVRLSNKVGVDSSQWARESEEEIERTRTRNARDSSPRSSSSDTTPSSGSWSATTPNSPKSDFGGIDKVHKVDETQGRSFVESLTPSSPASCYSPTETLRKDTFQPIPPFLPSVTSTITNSYSNSNSDKKHAKQPPISSRPTTLRPSVSQRPGPISVPRNSPIYDKQIGS
ncbi:hypothetical protein CI109_105831 [Kwoniella shandongensis]|uniref:Uncharacterized protein n=1 Tax=Kwoniella shandongensis TaxID=1734106 RepID=A0A5M6BT07_9TREE|nr:uncharacterized protein CI109_005734 [Kwoniella shandongensis]KAA5525986.1 hypothetical protein CI109_005734 [Kwoniella shandongensis]